MSEKIEAVKELKRSCSMIILLDLQDAPSPVLKAGFVSFADQCEATAKILRSK